MATKPRATGTAGKAAKTAPKKKASKKAAPPAPSGPDALPVGGKAPQFNLPGDEGQMVRLRDFAGQKLVIFFYPRANTPGCTLEARDFTRLKAAFAKAGTVVLGISADPLPAQKRFRDSHALTVPLASDETHDMLKAYGAWGAKAMYGKSFEGVLRSTVLIDASGRIARVWRKVKVAGHAEDVLAAARAI